MKNNSNGELGPKNINQIKNLYGTKIDTNENINIANDKLHIHRNDNKERSQVVTEKHVLPVSSNVSRNKLQLEGFDDKPGCQKLSNSHMLSNTTRDLIDHKTKRKAKQKISESVKFLHNIKVKKKICMKTVKCKKKRLFNKPVNPDKAMDSRNKKRKIKPFKLSDTINNVKILSKSNLKQVWRTEHNNLCLNRIKLLKPRKRSRGQKYKNAIHKEKLKVCTSRGRKSKARYCKQQKNVWRRKKKTLIYIEQEILFYRLKLWNQQVHHEIPRYKYVGTKRRTEKKNRVKYKVKSSFGVRNKN